MTSAHPAHLNASHLRRFLGLTTLVAMASVGCDSGSGNQTGGADSSVGADTAPPACSTATECPAPANPCEVAACVANVCSGVPAPAGTLAPAEAQVVGDCKEFTCGEGGALTTRAAPNDLPADDGNPCTSEVCDGPNPTHPALEVGTACGEEGICNAAAVCAECLPGAVGCEGDVPRSCDVDGAWVSEAACPFVCQGAAVCGGECKPGARDCSGRQPRVCNDAGAWQAEGDVCAFVCAAGACAETCPPGALPEAVITVAQGDEVLLGTILALSAADSMPSSDSPITRWQWSVVQPSGSVSTFAPSASVQDVTFEVNLVGEYQFSLKVWDAAGVESCTEATYTVFVVSDEAIHVELVWDTPGDADQTDTGFDFFGNSVGTDLDLHFLHPSADNTWFHSLYDCYWLNTNPNWSSAGPLANPFLTRDDSDGAGPETLILASPEFDKTYRIGAHYWDEWGFGPSFATIRVYIYGELRFEWERVNVVMNDMWDVATITWPAQTVTGVTTTTGEPVITPNVTPTLVPVP